MAVTAQMVKELREKTGAPMMDCKKALDATDGNMEEAITWLREKGIAKAAKKESSTCKLLKQRLPTASSMPVSCLIIAFSGARSMHTQPRISPYTAA